MECAQNAMGIFHQKGVLLQEGVVMEGAGPRIHTFTQGIGLLDYALLSLFLVYQHIGRLHSGLVGLEI